jgi:RNA polymerase sigma-70 factor (ECF subfamily)
VAGLSLLTGSRAEAEDAVCEALARAWERSERGEHIESLKAWVAVVATNLQRSRIRRLLTARRHRPEESPTRDPEAVEDRLDVVEALRSLPMRQREVTVLHYFADLGLGDISRAVGISEGAVKAMLHRARRNLATALGEPDPDREEDERARPR